MENALADDRGGRLEIESHQSLVETRSSKVVGMTGLMGAPHAIRLRCAADDSERSRATACKPASLVRTQSM